MVKITVCKNQFGVPFECAEVEEMWTPRVKDESRGERHILIGLLPAMAAIAQLIKAEAKAEAESGEDGDFDDAAFFRSIEEDDLNE